MIRDNMSVQEERIENQLREVIDPELMISIVELGLVYNISCDTEKQKINVEMTLTSPGCPLGDTIMQDAHRRLLMSWPGYEINIELVWEPQWTTTRISEEGKAKLNSR